MTLQDDMKLRLRNVGLRPADADECMNHVVQELKSNKVFIEYHDVNCWKQPLERFNLREICSLFEGYVLEEALRWMTYRYYDTLDGEYPPRY